VVPALPPVREAALSGGTPRQTCETAGQADSVLQPLLLPVLLLVLLPASLQPPLLFQA
jgi:hypothetical protein